MFCFRLSLEKRARGDSPDDMAVDGPRFEHEAIK